MAKNTGMTEKDVKAGRTSHLSPSKAKEVTEALKNQEKDIPPSKTVASVIKLREKQKNENEGVLLKHKPIDSKK